MAEIDRMISATCASDVYCADAGYGPGRPFSHGLTGLASHRARLGIIVTSRVSGGCKRIWPGTKVRGSPKYGTCKIFYRIAAEELWKEPSGKL